MHATVPLTRHEDELGALRRLTVRMLRAAAAGDSAHLEHLRAARGACLDALAARGGGAVTGTAGRRD